MSHLGGNLEAILKLANVRLFLKATWKRLGVVLGRLEVVLAPSWSHLGATWSRLGASLGALGAILGPSWGHLAPSWPILAYLVRFWNDFGTILGPFWDDLGTVLGLFLDHFGMYLAPLLCFASA